MMVLFLFFSSRFGAGILKEEANKYLRSFTGASLIFNCVYGCYNLNQYLMSEENIISLALGTNIFLFCWMAHMFIFHQAQDFYHSSSLWQRIIFWLTKCQVAIIIRRTFGSSVGLTREQEDEGDKIYIETLNFDSLFPDAQIKYTTHEKSTRYYEMKHGYKYQYFINMLPQKCSTDDQVEELMQQLLGWYRVNNLTIVN